MLLNDVDTQGKVLGLTAGIHQVSLFNLETIDPYDYIRIVGLEGVEFQWRYSGETSWREPDTGNELTEYADSIGQELRIELNVIGGGEFLFRTDDTFEYPNDDAPTNPIIDLEVLKQGSNYYSAIADDYLGAVDNNILSTDSELGAIAAEEIEQDFFHGMVDLSSYGVEGTAALWVTEPGINQVSIKGDGGKLLFWDGEKIIPLKISAGTNQLLLNAVADEWGLVLLDSFDADGVSTVTVDDIEWLGDFFTDIGRQDSTHYSLFRLGDTEADLVNGTFMVGTGTGDRAVSTLGKEIIGDRQYLKPYGTEGSLVTVGGLDNGVYQFNLEQLGKIDTTNNDSLYAWNGKDLTLIVDNENGLITNSVDVIYGYLTFIGMDAVTKTGTTDFTITNLNRVDDLAYEAPIPISLIPHNYIGDVDLYENQTRISTGGGDRAVSTLTRELGIDLSGLGTEGSYGRWNVPNGIYEVTYYLYASENDFDRDDIYFYDGANLSLFDSRASATIQSSATRWISDWQTVEVEVTNGELTFIALDTVDKSGTTQLRIGGIERIGALSEEPDLTFSVTPDDSMGAVTNVGVISTGEGSVSSQVLRDTFFHNLVDLTQYGSEGSARARNFGGDDMCTTGDSYQKINFV